MTNGNQAPTPVTVVGASELAARAPSNIPDALNQLPQFQGSTSQYQSQLVNPAGISSGNFLNLRALGPVRALTLFDGMRLPKTSGSGLVDANLVPQLLVQRVEVVTGGASAAYGSDAVSGVINFVLDKKFEGLRYLAQGGISKYGDNATQRFGAAYGGSFLDDRLHLLASAEYYDNAGISSQAARREGVPLYAAVGINGGVGGSAANPYTVVANSAFNNVRFDGLFTTGPFANNSLLANGTLVPLTGQTVGAGICVRCNGSFHDPATISLVPQLRTEQAFGRLTYNITDSIDFYAQGVGARSVTRQNASTPTTQPGAPAYVIFPENAFLPAALATQIPAAGVGFSRQNRDLVTTANRTLETTIIGTAGLSGRLGGSWEWDVAYSYGRTRQKVVLSELDNIHLRAAVDAVRDPANGNIVCRVTLTNPGLYPGCVPINLFGEGSPSAAAIAYVRGAAIQRAENEQQLGTINLRGEPFSTWAGPVSVAIGGEIRHEELKQTSNSNPALPLQNTGIRGFGSGGAFFPSVFGVGAGSVTVKEGYGEVLVPLARDVTLAQSLDLNGAIRLTDYSTSGSVLSWKAGLTWSPFDGLRLRGARSRDIRAPTLNELFSGVQPIQTSFADPHTGVNTPVFQLTTGSATLKPEKANTLTLGAVLEPSFLPSFSLSVDYYDIRISNAIAQPYSLAQIVQLCENSGGTDALCAQINRPLPFSNRTPANAPLSVSLQPLNVASVQTRGVDAEASYRFELGGGDVGLRALGTYIIAYKQRQTSQQPFTNLAGNNDLSSDLGGLPRFRATGSIDYTIDRLTIRAQERFIGASRRSDITFFVDNHVSSVAYTDLNLSLKLGPAGRFGGSHELFFNVTNLFDRRPPLVVGVRNPGLAFPTFKSLFDVVGTQFAVGIRGTF